MAFICKAVSNLISDGLFVTRDVLSISDIHIQNKRFYLLKLAFHIRNFDVVTLQLLLYVILFSADNRTRIADVCSSTIGTGECPYGGLRGLGPERETRREANRSWHSWLTQEGSSTGQLALM